MVTQSGLTQIAQVWGQSDFSAASTFADELSGSRRSSYLAALVQAAGRISTDELLDWISGYRSDPAYPLLVSAAAQRLARQDADAALELVAGTVLVAAVLTAIHFLAIWIGDQIFDWRIRRHLRRRKRP